MIENPNDWFYHGAKYAIENKTPIQYGCAFLINEDAPESVVTEYKKYLNLIKKVFFSSGVGIFKPVTYEGQHHYKLIGFNKDLTAYEEEQADIFKKLIADGYVSNDPFI